jgi:hypothetical protein
MARLVRTVNRAFRESPEVALLHAPLTAPRAYGADVVTGSLLISADGQRGSLSLEGTEVRRPFQIVFLLSVNCTLAL